MSKTMKYTVTVPEDTFGTTFAHRYVGSDRVRFELNVEPDCEVEISTADGDQVKVRPVDVMLALKALITGTSNTPHQPGKILVRKDDRYGDQYLSVDRDSFAVAVEEVDSTSYCYHDAVRDEKNMLLLNMDTGKVFWDDPADYVVDE